MAEEDVVVVGNPEYVARLRGLLGETPLRVQVSYIIWRISAATLSYLHEEAEDIAFQFASALSGQRQVLFNSGIVKLDCNHLLPSGRPGGGSVWAR